MDSQESVQLHELVPLTGSKRRDTSIRGEDVPQYITFSLSEGHEYYGGIHSIHFHSTSEDNLSGKIHMVEGGGQSITFDGTGKYQFIPIDETCGQLTVTNLIENTKFWHKEGYINNKYNDFTIKYTINKTKTFMSMPYGGNTFNPLECKYYEHDCTIKFELDPIKASYSMKRQSYYSEDSDIFHNISRVLSLKEFVDEGIDITEGKGYFHVEKRIHGGYTREAWIKSMTQMLIEMEVASKTIIQIHDIVTKPKDSYRVITFYDEKVNMVGFIIVCNSTSEDYESKYMFYPYIYIKPEYKDKINIEEHLLDHYDFKDYDYKAVHLAIPEHIHIVSDRFPKYQVENSDIFSKNMMTLIKNNEDCKFDEQQYESFVLLNMNSSDE
jgi:hypothetical protein